MQFAVKRGSRKERKGDVQRKRENEEERGRRERARKKSLKGIGQVQTNRTCTSCDKWVSLGCLAATLKYSHTHAHSLSLSLSLTLSVSPSHSSVCIAFDSGNVISCSRCFN